MASNRLVVLTAAALLALIATCAVAAGAQPRLTIADPTKDFGTVPKGEKLEWSFVVKNTGDADLEITTAKPGRDMTVSNFDKVIRPGATGKVIAQVDTTPSAGPISRSVAIETNDPTTPTARLTVRAIVKPYIEAYPAGFVRYNVLQGQPATERVVLYSEEDEPFEIKTVEVVGDSVEATCHKIERKDDLVPNVGRAGQNQWEVSVTVRSKAKVGPLADKVRVVTNSKHQPEYMISVSGVVRPPFRIEPTTVDFGEVVPGTAAASRVVLVHSNDQERPEDFVVTKAESSTPAVVASIKLGANKGDYEVVLQIAKDARPGDVAGSVKIYTNDKITPVVTVPVTARVKG